MKMFFEEPEVRVEKFTAESVMDGNGFNFLSGYSTFVFEEDRTHAIKPY